MQIRSYMEADIPQMIEIWNHVVEEGNAFPREETLTESNGSAFFAGQTYCGVACEGKEILRLYILHPNNVGRCGHIANASCAVRCDVRGKLSEKSLCRIVLNRENCTDFPFCNSMPW